MMGLGKCIETASNVAAFWCIYVKFRGCIRAKKTTPGEKKNLSCQLQCLHGWPSKNRGGISPKMDGENNGKPYEQMDDFGVPLFLG